MKIFDGDEPPEEEMLPFLHEAREKLVEKLMAPYLKEFESGFHDALLFGAEKYEASDDTIKHIPIEIEDA